MVMPHTTELEKDRRAALVERVRLLDFSLAGTRVKYDNRVFFVRKSRNGKVRIVERNLIDDQFSEKDFWTESCNWTKTAERVMKACLRQRA